MDEHTIPLEAGIEDRAISLTKGCYVGQEVIIRVLDRGQGRVADGSSASSGDPAAAMLAAGEALVAATAASDIGSSRAPSCRRRCRARSASATCTAIAVPGACSTARHATVRRTVT